MGKRDSKVFSSSGHTGDKERRWLARRREKAHFRLLLNRSDDDVSFDGDARISLYSRSVCISLPPRI